MFPEWQGDVFVTALGGQHVAKLDLDGDIVRASHGMLEEVGGRIRDIKEASDGSLYILSQTHGLRRLYRDYLPNTVKPRIAADGKIEPPMGKDMLSDAPFLVRDPADQASDHPGKLPYIWACGGCHDSGAGSAPTLGNADEWRAIMAQNPRVTRDHVMFGYRAMPARGFCNTCRPSELFDAVGYMFEEAAKNFN
jgi:cytochrome c5